MAASKRSVKHKRPTVATTNAKANLGAAKQLGEKIPDQAPAWYVCDPTGRKSRKLWNVLSDMETLLREKAASTENFRIVMFALDKARQTPLNLLQGKEEGGEASMQAYLDLIEQAADEFVNGGSERCTIALNRVSPYSDEGVVIIAGPNLDEDIAERFKKKIREVKETMDLSEYTYEVNGVELDLERFSHSLRHPELAVAYHLHASEVVDIRPELPDGFLGDILRVLENEKITFYSRLPKCFRQDGGKAEVSTPFGLSDIDLDKTEISGNVFQMKITTEDPKDTEALLEFMRATRKGWTGVLTKMLGQSDGNTFMGDSRNNAYFLTPICMTFFTSGSPFQPVYGYTTYRTDADVDPEEIMKDLIEESKKHMPKGLSIAVRYVNADSSSIEEVRQKLALSWMDEDCRNGLLPLADFVLNFQENVSPTVSDHIRWRLKMIRREDGTPYITDEDDRNLTLITDVCTARRTVRELSDLRAILMFDKSIAQDVDIKEGEQKKLVEWVWDFAKRNGERIKETLTGCIARI